MPREHRQPEHRVWGIRYGGSDTPPPPASLPSQAPPYAGKDTFAVIMLTPFMAERAVILMPFVWSGFDADMFYTIGIRVKAAAFNNSVLDI